MLLVFLNNSKLNAYTDRMFVDGSVKDLLEQ